MRRKGLVMLAQAVVIGALLALNGPDSTLSWMLILIYAVVVMMTANPYEGSAVERPSG